MNTKKKYIALKSLSEDRKLIVLDNITPTPKTEDKITDATKAFFQEKKLFHQDIHEK